MIGNGLSINDVIGITRVSPHGTHSLRDLVHNNRTHKNQEILSYVFYLLDCCSRWDALHEVWIACHLAPALRSAIRHQSSEIDTRILSLTLSTHDLYRLPLFLLKMVLSVICGEKYGHRITVAILTLPTVF